MLKHLNDAAAPLTQDIQSLLTSKTPVENIVSVNSEIVRAKQLSLVAILALRL